MPCCGGAVSDGTSPRCSPGSRRFSKRPRLNRARKVRWGSRYLRHRQWRGDEFRTEPRQLFHAHAAVGIQPRRQRTPGAQPAPPFIPRHRCASRVAGVAAPDYPRPAFRFRRSPRWSRHVQRNVPQHRPRQPLRLQRTPFRMKTLTPADAPSRAPRGGAPCSRACRPASWKAARVRVIPARGEGRPRR